MDLTKVGDILQKTLSGDCRIMYAKGKVGFLTMPVPKVIRRKVRDDALIYGNSAIRQKGLRKSEGGSGSAKKEASF